MLFSQVALLVASVDEYRFGGSKQNHMIYPSNKQMNEILFCIWVNIENQPLKLIQTIKRKQQMSASNHTSYV